MKIDEIKHSTCLHRSFSLEDLTIAKPCCSGKSKQTTGYICWERNIENVLPNDCEGCSVYVQRIDVQKIVVVEETDNPFA